MTNFSETSAQLITVFDQAAATGCTVDELRQEHPALYHQALEAIYAFVKEKARTRSIRESIDIAKTEPDDYINEFMVKAMAGTSVIKGLTACDPKGRPAYLYTAFRNTATSLTEHGSYKTADGWKKRVVDLDEEESLDRLYEEQACSYEDAHHGEDELTELVLNLPLSETEKFALLTMNIPLGELVRRYSLYRSPEYFIQQCLGELTPELAALVDAQAVSARLQSAEDVRCQLRTARYRARKKALEQRQAHHK